jgi:hypothetical protein
MRNIYTIIIVFIVLFIIFLGLFYVDIPSPSKLIKETYEIENK